MIPDDIFDRAARRATLARSLANPVQDRWLIDRMAEELIDRLDTLKNMPRKALVIGHLSDPLMQMLTARNINTRFASPDFVTATAGNGVQCDEDRLPFADAQFDLVIALGTLDTVNDLPGALALIRRSLRPDGVFLGAMVGAGSLPALRRALTETSAGGTSTARTHPMIDVRAAGDLLSRAGFALPVADCDTLTVNYSKPERLISDLRAIGLSNVLPHRRRFSRSDRGRLMQLLSVAPLIEQFAILYLTGWSPISRSME